MFSEGSVALKDVFTGSAEPKVVLKKINPKALEPMSSKGLRSHPPPPPKVKKETQLHMKHKRKKLVTSQLADQKKINSDHPLSVDDDDDPGPKEMEHTMHYSSSQPRVVLNRLKPEVLRSLYNCDKSNRCPTAHNLPIFPLVEKKETEPQSRMEKPVDQNSTNGHDFSASEDDDVHGTTCHYSASQPVVVLTRIKTELIDAVSNNSSPYCTIFYRDIKADSVPCPIQKTETKETLTTEGSSVQSEPQEKDDYVSSSVSSEPQEKDDYVSSSVSSEGEEVEYKPDKRKYVLEDSPEEDAISSEESDISCVNRKPVHASNSKIVMGRINKQLLDSGSDRGSSRWSKGVKPHPPARPSTREKPGVRLVTKKKINYCELSSHEERKEERIRMKREEEIPHPSPRPSTRNKPGVRLVTQKKINYCDFLSDEEEENIYESQRLSDQDDWSESDIFSGGGSYSSSKRRLCKRRNNEESEAYLIKVAMEDTQMSEYEQQRQRNIDEKLAFLKYLKNLAEVDLENHNGFTNDD